MPALQTCSSVEELHTLVHGCNAAIWIGTDFTHHIYEMQKKSGTRHEVSKQDRK